MRTAITIGIAFLALGLILAMSAVASGQEIPCGVTGGCPPPPGQPQPPPVPGESESWATNLWIWAVTAIVTAAVSFAVGLMAPLRRAFINWLESKSGGKLE